MGAAEMITTRFMALLVGATLLHAAESFAQTTTTTAETTVESNEMDYIAEEKRTIFRGNVVAKRDKTTIKSDTLEVLNVDVKQPDGTSKSEVDVMKARGNVTIKTEDETITSENADIHDREDRLEAWGNVKLVQGSNVVRGQKLTVNLDTKRSVMKGGRVKGSFVPQ
jgi:lipopolysaccharide export system protein LptA